jgi:hypothetical protein
MPTGSRRQKKKNVYQQKWEGGTQTHWKKKTNEKFKRERKKGTDTKKRRQILHVENTSIALCRYFCYFFQLLFLASFFGLLLNKANTHTPPDIKKKIIN